MHRRRWFPGRGTWGRRLVFGAVGLCVIVVAAVVVRGWWEARQVEAELARIRAAGEPVTYDELAAMYNAYPADEEATQLWLDAFAAQRPFNADLGWDLPMIGTGGELPAPGVEWAQLEDVEKYLTYQGEFLRLLHLAAEHEGRPRLPVPFGSTVTGPTRMYAGPLRSAGRLLMLEAYARAHNGDAAGAVSSLRAGLACGRTLEPIPDTTALTTMIALDAMPVGNLTELLSGMVFTDAQLARIQVALREAQYKNSLHRALLGERVEGTTLLKEFGWYRSTGPGKIALRGDVASYLRRARLWFRKAKQPWDVALQGVNANWPSAEQRSFFGLDIELASESLDAHWELLLVGAATQAARFELADAAIAVKRYEMRHGRWPDGLEQLVPEFLPEVPRDPFDGEPLRYVCDGDRCVVYSIGSDGIDDGGDGGLFQTADIVFHIGAADASERAKR